MQQVTSPSAPLSVLAIEHSATRRARWRGSVAGYAGTLFVLIAIAAPILLQRFITFDPGMLLTFGYLAVFFMGMLGSITFFLPVPTLSLVFAGATVLNPLVLAIVAAAGITLGMAACYALGRSGSRVAERSRPDEGTRLHRGLMRVTEWYRSNLMVSSFFLAAVPNPMFVYAGYFAGLTGVSQRQFLIGTFAGKTVQSLVVALIGFYAFDQIDRIW